MKAESTIRRQQRVLRRECIEGSDDPAVSRIAQAIEYGIRWAREDVVGWPTPAQEAHLLADILRKEILP